MHKKTTLQRFTVFLLKSALPILFLSFAFQIASAQNLSQEAMNAKKKSQSATALKPVDMTRGGRRGCAGNPPL
jgi:hypothetical protein